MSTATVHWLTGLEPAPLIRHRNAYILSDTLDTVACVSDEALVPCLPRGTNLSYYHVYSVALFYRDMEQDPEEYAGFLTAYTSFNAGKPTVHMYCWQQAVCWNGKDSMLADIMRVKTGLRRYLMFLRMADKNGYTWEFHHAGQLPIYRVKEG